MNTRTIVLALEEKLRYVGVVSRNSRIRLGLYQIIFFPVAMR